MQVAYLVLILSLIPTVVVYYCVKAYVDGHDKVRFDRIVREQTLIIEQNIPNYVDDLIGMRGLFAANSDLSSNQWSQYISTLGIPKRRPGIRSIGYLKRVGADEKGDFLLQRQSGDLPFQIRPDGERPVYFPTVLMNRFDDSTNFEIGLDHFADPRRHAAMEMARDTGEGQASERLLVGAGDTFSELAGTNDQTGADTNKMSGVIRDLTGRGRPGVAIYMPVYQAGGIPATEDERRTNIQGYIFEIVETEPLLKGLVSQDYDPQVRCSVFEGDQLNQDHVLYGDPNIHNESQEPHELQRVVHIGILNRRWTLCFTTLPAFELESQRNLPAIALICWLTLAFLLFGITYGEVGALNRVKRILNDLQRSETALASEKERLAVTLYSITEGVITTNPAGVVLSINKMAEELTGWPQVEALGRPVDKIVTLLNDKTREPVQPPHNEALKLGAASNLDSPALLLARNGKEHVVLGSAAPVRNLDGGILGAVLVLRDITARQKSEAEMLKESKLESVGLLAGGIAHDFNNILQGIIGNLSLARIGGISQEKLMERLDSVEKSAMRAKDLTQQLVMFSRGGEPIRKRLHIEAVVREAAQMAVHGSNSHCEFSIAEGLLPVDVDEGQFRQVISNLTLNAVQSMPDGGKVLVGAENKELKDGEQPGLKAGNYVRIYVRDHGTGISPADLPKIFDPYFTTKKHARGLGLASAYSVVRRHEGRITVDTRAGEGSCFSLFIPASTRKSGGPSTETLKKEFHGSGRILLMDDEKEILSLLKEMVGMMGFEAETARDGAEAISKYMEAKTSGRPFSLVIMDLTVPEGMGGKEAIRRLREMDPQVRAVVSSGYSLDPVMANYRDFGFNGVMPKPYVIAELGRVIQEVMAAGT
jgi:PAS domain S-box-containing protein